MNESDQRRSRRPHRQRSKHLFFDKLRPQEQEHASESPLEPGDSAVGCKQCNTLMQAAR